MRDVCFIPLTFIIGTLFLTVMTPFKNDIISIQQLLHLLPAEGDIPNKNNQRSLDQLCFSFDDFSQSTACIITRFRECSSTLLDKRWYLYSYMYCCCHINDKYQTKYYYIKYCQSKSIFTTINVLHHDKL